MTPISIYKLDKKFEATPQRTLALRDVTGVSISRYRDQVVVVHAKDGHDVVLR